jgi:hypothetical protein
MEASDFSLPLDYLVEQRFVLRDRHNQAWQLDG